MENTMSGIGAGVRPESARPARPHFALGTFKLWLLWSLVGVPLFWGVMKALEDVPYLFQ